MTDQNQTSLQTIYDFADVSQRMLETLENTIDDVKREVICSLANHIVVQDDVIIH